ncbi:MAG TPA: hypothetical protein VNB23_04090 [Ramlibacter sp.]|nr:hypothetical protein [Ramlibacter sp.]
MKNIVSTLALAAVLPAQAGLAEDVAAQEARLQQLRQAMVPVVAPLLVNDAHARVFLSLTPVAQALAGLNALPAASRTIVVQSTGRNGNFWSDGDWCNSYVELDAADSLRARAELSQLKATFRDDGIELGTHAAVRGKVQVKFQFKGRRVHVWPIGNVCPPGGGTGFSIGVDFAKDLDLGLLLSFARSADGQSLAYSARFIRPNEVNVTAQIGLQHIGTIGHPMSFALPNTPVASGSVPLLLGRQGTLRLPGVAQPRTYAFQLTPTAFSTAGQAVTAAWKAKVVFDAPAP